MNVLDDLKDRADSGGAHSTITFTWTEDGNWSVAHNTSTSTHQEMKFATRRDTVGQRLYWIAMIPFQSRRLNIGSRYVQVSFTEIPTTQVAMVALERDINVRMNYNRSQAPCYYLLTG